MSRHLLVVGAQRCGTTAVHALLDGHPEIAMARPARPEPKVFTDPEAAARGAEWYRATYFGHASAGQLLGDKSTSYLEDPEAPGRAAAALGSPQVLVVLRDPLERAVSNWRLSTAHGLEDRPLEEALRENLQGPRAWDRAATSVSPFAYLERGRYADYLRPWTRTFPDTVHVAFLRELVEDGTAVTALWQALGVSPTAGPLRLDTSANRSGGPRPALPEELVVRVRAYYASSDQELASLLGRSLPW